jgi:nucleoside-diphosphate-sugar epimerase
LLVGCDLKKHFLLKILKWTILNLHNVLITGADGFIGSALCRRMLDEGWGVYGAIRSSAQKHLLPRGINVLEVGSIDAYTEWEPVICGIDIIVHLAARVHVIDDHASDPLTTYREINVAATKRLAQIAESKKVRRFVFVSSIKVNGEGGSDPYTEKNQPAPVDPYGVSKLEAENVLHDIAGKRGLEIVILRPPLVYGPGVKANFLKLIKMISIGIPLPLAGLNNLLSMIYLGNLIDAILTCLCHPKAAGQTYLLSDGEDVSTPELIRRISFALGKPARLFPFPPVMLKMAGIITGKSAVMDRLLRSLTIDCSKIRRELNWQAPFSMDQGLKETAEWYLKQRSEVRGRMSVS